MRPRYTVQTGIKTYGIFSTIAEAKQYVEKTYNIDIFIPVDVEMKEGNFPGVWCYTSCFTSEEAADADFNGELVTCKILPLASDELPNVVK